MRAGPAIEGRHRPDKSVPEAESSDVTRSFRVLHRALAAGALTLTLLALLAPAAEANKPNCSASSGPYPAHEDWVFTPESLDAGDTFRLLFATSATRSADSVLPSVYNTFVRNAAKGGHGQIPASCGNRFNAIISTQYDSARFNTRTRSTDTDAPIWWVKGDKVADNYADFYDGSWDSRIARNEYGTTPISEQRVWTGSLSNGHHPGSGYAGHFGVEVHRGHLKTGDPLNAGSTNSGAKYRLYGLSPIFTVVKAPRLSISLNKTSGNELNSAGGHATISVKLDQTRPNDTSFKMCVKTTSTATFRTSTSTNDRDFDLYEYLLDAQGQLVELAVDASNCHTMTIKTGDNQNQAILGFFGDTLKEENETVVLELKDPPSGVKIASSGRTATYTITNDDSEPTVTITGGATASEGTNATFTVKSSHAPKNALSVKVNITEAEDADTGKNHVDADDEGVRTVTVAAGSTSQSFTVPTTEDWVDEPDGVITATVQAGTGYVVGQANKSAQVNVQDDDTRGFVFRPAKLKLKEGGSATYTVALTSRPLDEPEGVTVTLTPLGDFTVDTDTSKDGNQTTLRFDAVGGNLWQSGQTVKVTANEDANSTDDTTAINHEGSGAGYGPRPGADFGASRGIVVTVTDNDVPHLVVAPTELSVTEGGSSTFTVQLGTQPSADGTLAFASTNPDITFNPASLSYFKNDSHQTQGWDKVRTVTVHAASDNDIGDDAATLTVTASGGDYEGKTATIAATVTDTTTPALVLSTSTLAVMEGASTTYTVKLAARPTGTVTVAIGSNNGDVMVDTDNDDTNGNQNRLTFNANGSNLWSTAQTVKVTTRGDANTASEAVTLTHTASGGGYGAVRKTLSGTVTDDGKKTVAFAQTDYPVIEGKGPVTVTLVMSEARSATTNVRVSATPLTATGSGVDYTGLTFVATFAAGSTSATFEIPIRVDDLLEDANGERFRVDIYDGDFPNDLKKVRPDLAYVTIYDAAVLSFTRPDTTRVFEGGRALEFTLDARAPYFDEADGHGFAHVRLSGRASSHSDYRIEYWYPGLGWTSSTRFIAIPAGTPSARVRVTALEDGRKEGSETATLTLIELPKVYRDTGQPFYRAGTPRTVSFTVADRETVAPRLTSVAHHDPAASTAVSPASLTWRVTFNEEVHAVDASDFTLTGTSATLAVARVAGTHAFDVTASGGNLGRITGGQVTLGLAPDNDITDGSGNAFTRWNEFTSTYWVHDGTTPPPPGPTVTVEAQLPGVAVTEGQRVSFLLPASPTPTADFPVNITVTQSGNVVSAETLSTNQTTIRRAFGAGAVGPKTQDDSIDEPDGSVTVTLDSGTGYTVGSPSSATIVVRDNDPTVVSLTRTGTGAVTEGGTVELDVTLGRALVAGETIDVPLAIGGTGVTTGDWSLGKKSGATNTGVALLDAGTTTPKVRFEGAGAQTATLELTVTADGTAEGTETFTVALGSDSTFDDSSLGTNVGGGADPHGTDNTFDVTVNDGAAPPPGTPAVGFASATSSAAEDAGTHNVTLDLAPAAPSGGLDIAYAVTGTATAGSGNDFTIAGSGTLSVAAGATTATIPVAIIDDSTDDDAETVVLTLNPGTGYTLGGTTVHTLTIADNDDPITPAACVSAQLLSDVQGYAGENRPNSPDHVPRWSRVLAAFGESNSYSNNPMTVAEAQAQAARGLQRWVPVVTALECLEGTTPPAVPQVTVQGGSAVTEGGNAVFTVSASSSPAAALTVTLTVADDASSDFLSASDQGEKTVSIASGQTSATLTVPTQNDSTDEANGSVTATVSSGTGYTVGSPSTATVAVSDNDPTPQGTPVVRIAAGTGITEGASAEFTLTASPTPTASITVNVAVAQSGAFATSGQTGTRTVTIGAGGTATLTVATDNDGTDETNGSITATVQTGTGYTAHGTQNVATVAVTDDDVPVVRVTGGAGITEGGTAAFTLTASPTPATAITINVAITQSGDFAGDGQTVTRTVTIGTGGTGTVNVTTVNDTADEPDGTITATVQTGTGYTVAAAPNHAASVTVADDDATTGVPTISIADATLNENERLGWFTVRLSKATDQDVRFAYATRESTPVSATANRDYSHVPRAWRIGSRIRAGETFTEIRIGIRDDSHDENPETFEVELFDAFMYRSGQKVPVSITDDVAVGTITNDDPMPAAWLSRFGRTVAEQALDGISGRLSAPRTAGTEGTFGGISLQPRDSGDGDSGHSDQSDPFHSFDPFSPFNQSDPVPYGFGIDGIDTNEGVDGMAPPGIRTMTLQELLLGSHFTATGPGDSSGGSLALWGRAAHSSFDGREGTFSLDGEATTALLGTDYARGKWLVGLALLQSGGEGGYRDTETGSRAASQLCTDADHDMDPQTREVLCGGAVREGDGTVESSLTAAVPYGAIRVSERLKLWGALGYGTGEVTLKPEVGGSLRSDLTWTMASAGLRGDVIALPAQGSGPALVITSDALWSRTESDRTSELAASDSDVTRLRLGLEGSWRIATEGGGHVTPKVELGLRRDGGDAESGSGVEVGGGIAWVDPSLGLSLDLSGRTLITHEADDLEDRGFAASLAFDPDPASERGLSLALRQEMGGQAEGGLDALFRADPLEDRTGSGETAARWTVEAAYGFPALGGRFTGSPHAGIGFMGDGRDVTVGWRLSPVSSGVPDVSFGVRATRRESLGTAPTHGVGFEMTVRW